jgi:hypothetical protein
MTPVAKLIAATLLATACGPPPALVDAHLLERAASWAAAAQFAADLRDRQSVPDSYVRQVTAQGASEVRDFGAQFKTTDRGSALCGRLSSALSDGDPSAHRAQLRDLEGQLRDLAQDRRRAAGSGAAR